MFASCNVSTRLLPHDRKDSYLTISNAERKKRTNNSALRLIGGYLPLILAGLGAWHVTGDRSNAGGVVGSVGGAPGTADEVFLAAQEAVQAHRDSQGRLIRTIFHPSPTPVTIGTRNWSDSPTVRGFVT